MHTDFELDRIEKCHQTVSQFQKYECNYNYVLADIDYSQAYV